MALKGKPSAEVCGIEVKVRKQMGNPYSKRKIVAFFSIYIIE